MNVLLIGNGGTVSSQLAAALREHDHNLQGMLASFNESYLSMFKPDAVIVVGPESQTTTDALVNAIAEGTRVYIISSQADGLGPWAAASRVPAFPYPPSADDMRQLLLALESTPEAALQLEQYRRTQLGADIAGRLENGRVVRRIAVTSPKGGTGKTTVAVNLAVLFALCGVPTYLVDADANAGSLYYHLRLHNDDVRTTLMRLLRAENARPASDTALRSLVSAAQYAQSFTPLHGLPALAVLPGLATDDLADEALHDEGRVHEVISGLAEVGASAGGITIMDVGINPAHVVHRAALAAVESMLVVIRPQIPDLGQTVTWLDRLHANLATELGSREAARDLLARSVQICYNQVPDGGLGPMHKYLRDTLDNPENKRNGHGAPPDIVPPTPNGILPTVASPFAQDAVNSDRVGDLFIWRYQRDHSSELAPFANALVDLASFYMPAIRSAAERVLRLETARPRKRGLFGRR